MKYIKLSIYELAALCIIAGGVVIRLILISQNWPWTDSDEGTFGIMALHIAYHGDHPIFVYGQFYMGTLQAYLGAAMFHLFGPSLFSLRLGVLLLFIFFLVSLYLLTRTLYSRGLALLTITLLSLGSNYLLSYQLRAYGGYPETLLFGTLAFLIASWLAISSKRTSSLRSIGQRSFVYILWGLVVGLGIWSDQLVLPFIAMAGLLLLLFCWRELLKGLPVLGMLIGLAAGMLPLIIYNLHATPGNDSLSVLLKLQSGASGSHTSLTTLLNRAAATFKVTLPIMTGNPFCPVNEQATVLHDPTSPNTLSCTLIHSSWSLGYVLLFLCAFGLAAWMTWKAWSNWRNLQEDYTRHQDLARYTARLFLLCSALLAVMLYLPGTATNWPGLHARYVIGLLIATPAVLWPLWHTATTYSSEASRRVWINALVSTLIITLIGLLYLTGTLITFTEVSAARVSYQQNQGLITRLESIGARHVYAGYWTCNNLIFLSNEHVICGVITPTLQPSHNRYEPYYIIVKTDPHSAYVFTYSEYRAVLQHWVKRNPANYRVMYFEGFYITQPIITYPRRIKPHKVHPHLPIRRVALSPVR